jgi:hypothetical protein
VPVGADEEVSFQMFATCHFGNNSITQVPYLIARGSEADSSRVQSTGQVLENLTPWDGDGIDTEFPVQTGGVHPSDTRALARRNLESLDHPAMTVEFNAQSP